jgi:hypothetical protein
LHGVNQVYVSPFTPWEKTFSVWRLPIPPLLLSIQ